MNEIVNDIAFITFMLPSYMKVIDVEEVENELNKEFDMNQEKTNEIMRIIKNCILNEEEIKNQID
jgi:hypothetical protein